MSPKFATSSQTSQLFGISRATLKKWRIGLGQFQPILIEGVHWVRIENKDVRFNIALLEDFFINRENPAAHQRAIDAYLRSLPSSQAAS